jgi:hypothetical protein
MTPQDTSQATAKALQELNDAQSMVEILRAQEKLRTLRMHAIMQGR